MAKKLIVLLAAAAFSIGLAGNVFAEAGTAGMEEELKGIVTRIDGNNITIKDFMGVEKTVELKNPDAMGDLKVGDPAVVKGGFLSKEHWGGSEDMKPTTPEGASPHTTPGTNRPSGSGSGY